ncbi:PorV/PorQ family protein [candidate division KSB1 bacterium]|nr:PorV/PorQ family protein [candidate division KSB1 bacterium]
MRLITFSLLALFIVITIVASTALAGSGFKTAKYAGEFLNLGVGGRALGMGGAYIALARDVSATYWNPAGLVNIDYPQIMLMHSQQFAGVVKYDFGSFAVPFGAHRSLGLSLIRLGVDDIPETRLKNPNEKLSETNRPEIVRTFSDAEYALFLTYAVRRSHNFSLGGNVKIIYKGLGNNSAWGLGFDIAALYIPFGNLNVGLNLQDVTSTVLAWDTGRRELIVPALKAGLAYPIALPGLGGFMSPALDLEMRFEGRDYAAQFGAGPVSFDTHFGWEYQRELLALRLGSDVGQFTVGAGIGLPKLQIDYAFLSHGDLGDTHRISARLSIEEVKYRRSR